MIKPVKVEFAADKQLFYLFFSVLHNALEPFGLGVPEGLFFCHVEHYDDPISFLIECKRHSLIRFLTCSVPDLDFNFLAVGHFFGFVNVVNTFTRDVL